MASAHLSEPRSPAAAKACELIAAAQAKELVRKNVDEEADPGALAALPEKLGQCFHTGDAGWGVLLTDISGASHPYPPGSEEITHALQGGPTVVFAREGRLFEAPLAHWQNAFTDFEVELFTHDWDRDGTAELAACWGATFHVIGTPSIFSQRTCEIFRFERATARVAAVTPHDVRRFADVDFDGSPDLVTYDPFWMPGGSYSTQDCSMCIGEDIHGPELVAHALRDGTFSRTDAIAVAHARRGCPSPPKTILGNACKAEEFARVWERFSCAMLWGERVDVLRETAARARKLCCRDPSYCPEVDVFDKWIAAPPLAPILQGK